MNEKNTTRKKRPMSVGMAIAIFLLIGAAVAVQKVVFGGDMGAMFFMCWLVLIPIGYLHGFKSEEMEKAAFDFTKKSLPAVFILLAAGALIGCWIAAGTTPTMIYYGIKFINPKFFLVTAMLLCSVVSLFCGTSKGTIGTAGIAMMGIGSGLGIPPEITAGAVICGAFFGDKMSPMSDTTILASTITEVNIFKHIKHMIYDQVPCYIISLLFFMIIGFRYGGSIDIDGTAELMNGLESNFNLGIVALIPMVVTGVMLVLKETALVSILGGAVSAIFVSIFYQHMPVGDAFNVFYNGFALNTDSTVLAKLLNRGGISSVWSLAGLTLFGFTVAGMLEHMNVIGKIAKASMKGIRSTGSLTFTTILFGFIGNAIAFSQNFAIVMTGTLMAPIYKKYNLQPKNCSRDLEAGGTYGAMFVPWNSNTVFAVGIFGVPAVSFMPYIPLLYLTPIVVIIYSFIGYKMDRIYEDEGYVDVTERLANDPEKLSEISGLEV
ncbi:Na+/H+ antiporter NhaC [Wukongibacter sp. M2B1]|uniref:Na+/H+ antiporter NhaC n=1 Tax=Wukongibacter sp. M2B1 TaxID=3088895 RepID=UPI003D7AD2CF